MRGVLLNRPLQNTVVIPFKNGKFRNLQPWMAVESVNPQSAFDTTLFGDEALVGIAVIRGKDLHLMPSSAQLVQHHMTNQLISPEIMRGIEVGERQNLHYWTCDKVSILRENRLICLGAVPIGCERSEAVH